MIRILILILLAISLATSAYAKTVCLKNGDEITAASTWQRGQMVYVLVNRDTLLEIPAGEVDLKRTHMGAAKVSAAPRGGKYRNGKAGREVAKGVTPELVDQVMEVTGLAKQLNQLPALASRGALVNEQDPTRARSIANIVDNCYDPNEATRSVRNYFIQYGDAVTFNNVLNWLQTPTGRKVQEPPVILDENLLMNLKRYELELEDSPAGRRRLMAFRQIVQETRLVENLGETIEKTIDSITSVTPGSKEQRAELRKQVKQEVKESQPHLAEMMRRLLVSSYAYLYRDLSDEELSEYLRFLRSESGRRFMKLSNAAQMRIVDRMIANMRKYVAEELRT